MSKRTTHTLLFALATILAIAVHVAPRDYLYQSKRDVPFEQRDRYLLPPPEAIRVLALNYSTVAASMTWISGLVYFGDWRFSPGAPPPKYLENYGEAVRTLDPSFFAIYEWFDATFINAHLEQKEGVSHDVLVRDAKFLMEGREHFPERFELPYRAGSNFLGYSAKRSPEVRIKEYELGMHYLGKCLELPDCPAHIAPTRARMYDQKLKLEKELAGDAASSGRPQRLSEGEVKAYIEFLSHNTDPQIRLWLTNLLVSQGVDISSLNEYERLRRAHEARMSYLPVDLWSLTLSPILTTDQDER